MTKSTRIGWVGSVSLNCAVVFLLVSSTAWAQTNRDVVTINGGKDTIYLKTPTHVSSPSESDTSGLVTIYSNLGHGSNVYNGGAGVGVLGRGAGQVRPQWAAYGFTPTADHTVTLIKVAATYVSGANDVVMTLNADAGGIPGAPLAGWYFTNLPTFGSCCTLQVGRSKNGVPVKAGTLYWVVLKTPKLTDDTYDVWDNDIHGQQGPFSNDTGQGWQNGGIQQLGGFGVFGQ